MNNKSQSETVVLSNITREHKNRRMPEWKSPFFKLSQFTERLAVRFNSVAGLYFKLFYKNMLAREVALTDLTPGDAVLHIGGGSYPFTAIYLAEKGYQVDVCDCNREAANLSEKMVYRYGLTDRIDIYHKNGCVIDSSKYAAVWVSLNICPKEKVLERTWETLRPKGLLIYRKLPAWVALFGKRDVTFYGGVKCGIKKALSGFGAESLILEKPVEQESVVN